MAEKHYSQKKASRILFAAVIIAVFLLVFGSFYVGKAVVHHIQAGSSSVAVGTEIDSLHGIAVYYNGTTGHVAGRNTSADGYNIGQKWQCVEFIKRYYYEHFNHKMPDPWGHAKDFFNPKVADGALNTARGLLQFANGGSQCPAVGDLVVFDGHFANKYGHVAIVSLITPATADSTAYIEIIQQNPGPSAPSREQFLYTVQDNQCTVTNKRILGWLRLPA